MMKVCQNQKQRALIYLFSSTGARPEAIAELKMKHLEPIGNGCLSLRLYDGSLHEMYSFLHEKATIELKKYFEWREKQGEKINPESFVFVKTTVLSRNLISQNNNNVGKLMYDLMGDLFPICRSITGNGVRDTLKIISNHITLEIHEVADELLKHNLIKIV